MAIGGEEREASMVTSRSQALRRQWLAASQTTPLRRFTRFLGVSGLALSTLGLVGVGPAAADSPPTVVSCPGGDLQTAIDNAGAGDVLVVRGTCHGNFRISKDLTLAGRGATLDGDHAGTVVIITGAVVTISDITITHGLGHGTFGPIFLGRLGGGIGNQGGRVTLNRSPVIANAAGGDNIAGGGIFNTVGEDGSGGTMTLNNSPVSDNTAVHGIGGGIFSRRGLMTLNNSPVTGNSAENAGGIDNEEGRMILNRSPVSRNTTSGSVYAMAGGIYNTEGILELHSSPVADNVAGGDGGGITGGGTITLTNSPVTGNTAVSWGGGLQVGGTTTLINSPVEGNRSLSWGGGILNTGEMTVRTSPIRNNAASDGGGVFNGIGSLTIDSSSVTGNTADHDGGGIFQEGCCGGGVRLINTLVSTNTAGRDGGGIYNNAGEVGLQKSAVTDNEPNNCGGTSVAGCSG